MDRTEQVLRQKYNEIEQEAQVRSQEFAATDAALRAEIDRLKAQHLEMQRADEVHRFIADAIEMLATTSLDYKLTIENLARIAVPRIGDWCGVYMLESDDRVRRLAVAGNSGNGDLDPIEAILTMDSTTPSGPARVIHTGELEVADKITDELLQTLGLAPEEFASVAGDGPTSFICVPLPARGRSIGSIAFILKRQHTEADVSLARHLGRIAGMVIDNARLYREAKDANRLKDEFVAMVSHELRTPLTPILGCVHLMRTAKLTDATFQRALDMIERNAEAQVQIVEDLFDLSRVVAGKLHLNFKSVDIVSVVETAIDSVRSMAEAKTIDIEKEVDALYSLIDGDRDRLQQIIWNLLSNAVKFTPASGRIVVSVKAVDHHVNIEVADTGIGIAPEFLPYIFDRFRQGEIPDSKMKSGLGLGLAIVRHLVELHNGYIDAASPGVGQGTVFTLRLPMQTQKAAHAR